MPDDRLPTDTGKKTRIPGAHVTLFFRPHVWRIGFVVPHGVAEIAIHEHIGLMHVTDHALAGGNRARELMFQRMAALAFGYGFVYRYRAAVVAKLCVGAGMTRLAVVAIDHMAGRATGRPIITGLIV